MDQQKKQKHILMDKAFFYLRFRARSVSEMRQYLLKKSQVFKFSNTIVDSVIAELIEEKYINDTEFAQGYIRSRSQINPKGNYAIVQELQQKGVNKTIIEAALKENTIDELTRARDVLKKKNNQKEIVHYKKIIQNDENVFVCYSPKLYEEQISKKQSKIDEELKTIKQLSEKIKAGKKIKISTKINLPNEVLEQKVSLQKRLSSQTEQDIRKHLDEIHINGREGFYFLESSKNLTGKQAIQTYKNKDSIEKTMNSLKNEIEIKPTRVWTTSSIKGALIIGFLAQLFVSLAKYDDKRLKSLSTTTIVNSLRN